MKIIKLPVGYLKANCYILNKNGNNIIIDPGSEYEKIKQNIVGNISGILITHHHDDHTGAVSIFKNNYDLKIYDFSNLEEKKYNIDGFKFKVIYTKGHTIDSISYYFYEENIMFTGDFLFRETIGRTDFEDSDINEMIKSLKKIILFDNVKIYPGHGEETSLDYEKKHNYFLRNININ